MTLPNFLIVGAMKSGTSTLRDMLAELDSVHILPGEAHFFSDDEKYARGIDWYAEQFAGANGAIAVGEKTATYSYLPECVERIHSHLPDVKLVWIFRQPVSRTYSHYWHSVKNGNERLSFPAAIEQEPQRVSTDVWRGYQARSLYHEQVENYLRVFPRACMHFMLFEELLKSPLATMNALLTFLGAPELREPPAMQRSNETHIPRSRTVQWLARRMFDRRTSPYNLVNRLNRRSEPGYPRIDESTRARLLERFRDPTRRLAELTGLDLAAWDR
jgi:hypothetical protein